MNQLRQIANTLKNIDKDSLNKEDLKTLVEINRATSKLWNRDNYSVEIGIKYNSTHTCEGYFFSEEEAVDHFVRQIDGQLKELGINADLDVKEVIKN